MTGFLFLPPSGFYGHLIDLFTHKDPGVPNVCHVAVVVGGDSVRGYECVEAWAGEGVRRVLRKRGIFVQHDFDVLAAETWANRHLGEPYDWTAIPWMGVVGLLGFVGIHLSKNPFQRKGSWYCSELAITMTGTEKYFGGRQMSPQRMLNLLYKELPNVRNE